MSKKGQNNITGTEAQQWAALSLFLQHLSDPNFDRVELEPTDFHDFNLVFRDGHKIICESKCEKSNFTYADLKKILSSTLKKHEVNQTDIILIICLNLSEDFSSNVKMVKYLPEKYSKAFKKRYFTDAEIELIPKIKFWKASPDNNKTICSALLAEYFDFWVPENDLARFTAALKQYFNEAASKGYVFSRAELRTKISQLGTEIVKNTGDYDTERRNPEKMAKGLVEALKDAKHPAWAKSRISALSHEPYLLHFVFQKIQNQAGIDLRKWDDLWKINRYYGFSFNVFSVFSNNLHSRENKKYILTYIADNISSLRGFYRLDFFIDHAVKIAEKMLLEDFSLAEQIFQTIKSLLAGIKDDILYVKSNRDRDHQRDMIAQLLSNLFDKADTKTTKEIASYSADTFDLIHGRHETPGNIFSILHKYLVSNWKKFPERFKWLVKTLIGQYAKFYEGKLHNGWDHIGSTGAFWGRDYRVSDRKFVEIILKPVLSQFYKRSPEAAWKFIKEHCIIPQTKVSKNKPDFLNRAAIPVVLKQYKRNNKKASQEAFEILREFILSTKGIPVKFELIYQEIRREEFTDEQKWQLVRVSLIDKYENLPITPFVEQIVTELAQKGHDEARSTLRRWFSNPEYFRKHRIVDNAIPNIEAFLESDLTLATALFEQFISNDVFINKEDEFDTYDAAVVLQKILELNYEKGLEILKKLLLIKKPTINQQILISHGFFHHRDPNDKGDTTTLTKIFKDYVVPHLKKFSDPVYLTHSHSRASFLQFARKLAINDLISEALIIAKAFINDPDPYSPGKDPEDPEGKYSEQKRIEEGEGPHTITSVRGHCAWTLASCPAIPSRVHIKEIIELTKRLLNDPNWYVRHMACFSLKQLARNRLSVMPPKNKILYLDLNDDKSEALKMAKDIEAMAFGFLERLSKSTETIQKALAESALSPFDHIRALNQKDAERLLKIIKNTAIPLQEQFAPFLIYLSEFRGNSSVYQSWPWQVPGCYDDLQEFDDSPFRKMLEEWTTDGPAEIRTKLAWEYWALIQEAYKDQFEKHFPIALKYLGLASKKYEHGVFENIYRFIDDCIDTQFNECFALWKKCLETEKLFLDKYFDPYKMHWWPHHYNGRILIQVKNRLGDETFLEWLEFLSSYPDGARLEDLRSAVELLTDLPLKYNGNVKRIFNLLINRRKELGYCDLKDTWEKKLTGT